MRRHVTVPSNNNVNGRIAWCGEPGEFDGRQSLDEAVAQVLLFALTREDSERTKPAFFS